MRAIFTEVWFNGFSDSWTADVTSVDQARGMARRTLRGKLARKVLYSVDEGGAIPAIHSVERKRKPKRK